MKILGTLLLVLFASTSIAAMPQTEEELRAFIAAAIKAEARPAVIQVVKDHLISDVETKINRITLTRPTGAPFFINPHTLNTTTGEWVPSANATMVIKPQVGGYPVIMTGPQGIGPVDSSIGFIRLHRSVGGQPTSYFEINGIYDRPVGLILNPRQVSNAYDNRASMSLTVEDENLVIRNEYWGPTIFGHINGPNGWVKGVPAP